MPSTNEKCKLFRIKHTTLLEGETFLNNKHQITFFEIKCTFFGRKENTFRVNIKLPSKSFLWFGVDFKLMYEIDTHNRIGVKIYVVILSKEL